MEGTPLTVEGADDEESRKKELEEQERRQRLDNPGSLGIFAVESGPDQPSALEKAWAETKREPEDAGPESVPEPDTIPPPGTEIAPEVPETSAPPEVPPPVPAEVLPTPEPETPEHEAEAAPVEAPEPIQAEAPEPAPEPPAEAAPEPKAEALPEPQAAPEAGPAEEPAPPAESVSPETPEEPEPQPVEEAPTPTPEEAEELKVGHETPPPETPPEPVESKPDPVPAEAGPAPEPEAETRTPEPEVSQPQAESEPEPEADDTADAKPFAFSEGAGREEEPELPEAPPPEPPLPEAPPPEPPLPEQPPAEAETRVPEEQPPEEAPEQYEPEEHETPSVQEGYRPPAEAVAAPEEIRSSRAAEERMGVESAPKGSSAGRRIETLSQEELLGMAAEINIDGNNLRHIYETHLIGERGLRRLVEEYENGGDMREALRREMLEHEIDFERDPAMRDLASPDHPESDVPVDADNQLIDRLLENSGSHGHRPDDLAGQQDHYRQDDSHSWQQTRRSRSKAALDAIFISVISILFLLVIFVYLSRN